MTAIKLITKYVEKPWGRTQIPAIFPNPEGRKIGEIWFDGPEGERPPLLVKYIFTSEKLSIQVHPNDAEGRERGLPGGKEECWYILDAEPDATLGIGLTRALSGEELKAAALDGSIERLMDWKPVKPGDFFFIPAGTVHAIGAGITLVEVQQNVDVTYRLYDYGRPRKLHLEDGVAVSKAEPYPFPDRNLSLGSSAQLMPAPIAWTVPAGMKKKSPGFTGFQSISRSIEPFSAAALSSSPLRVCLRPMPSVASGSASRIYQHSSLPPGRPRSRPSVSLG